MDHDEGLVPRLVDAVYDAAMGTRDWLEVLADISSAISAEASVGELSPTRRRQPFTTSAAMSPADVLDYQNRMMPRDELLSLSCRYPIGSTVQSQFLMDGATMERTEIYNDLYRRIGLYYFCAAYVIRTDESWVIFSSYQTKAKGPLDSRKLGLFSELVPHVSRAIRFQRLVDTERSMAAGVMQSSDAAGLAVLLLDEAGTVLDMNQTATRLLAEGESPLRVVNGAVEGVVDGALRRLDLAPRPGRRSYPTLLKLGESFVGALIPLSPPHREALQVLSNAPAAALVVNVSGGNGRSLEARLSEVYGLTRAEARVAAAVAWGKSIPQAASQLGLSRETVRTQLKRVFSKTGTSRQAELALLVSRVPDISMWQPHLSS